MIDDMLRPRLVNIAQSLDRSLAREEHREKNNDERVAHPVEKGSDGDKSANCGQHPGRTLIEDRH